MAKKNGEFRCKVLFKIVLNKTEKSKTLIQVVKWGDNNPTLEKRPYFIKDGNWICGKSTGLNLSDFKKVLKHKAEIKAALGEENEE